MVQHLPACVTTLPETNKTITHPFIFPSICDETDAMEKTTFSSACQRGPRLHCFESHNRTKLLAVARSQTFTACKLESCEAAPLRECSLLCAFRQSRSTAAVVAVSMTEAASAFLLSFWHTCTSFMHRSLSLWRAYGIAMSFAAILLLPMPLQNCSKMLASPMQTHGHGRRTAGRCNYNGYASNEQMHKTDDPAREMVAARATPAMPTVRRSQDNAAALALHLQGVQGLGPGDSSASLPTVAILLLDELHSCEMVRRDSCLH